jgi:hypothetical protein
MAIFLRLITLFGLSKSIEARIWTSEKAESCFIEIILFAFDTNWTGDTG